MKTNTHPGDYQSRKPIRPQFEPLCSSCGGFMLPFLATGEVRCIDCDGTEVTMVMEDEAAEFREICRDADLWRDEQQTRESVRPL